MSQTNDLNEQEKTRKKQLKVLREMWDMTKDMDTGDDIIEVPGDQTNQPVKKYYTPVPIDDFRSLYGIPRACRY